MKQRKINKKPVEEEKVIQQVIPLQSEKPAVYVQKDSIYPSYDDRYQLPPAEKVTQSTELINAFINADSSTRGENIPEENLTLQAGFIKATINPYTGTVIGTPYEALECSPHMIAWTHACDFADKPASDDMFIRRHSIDASWTAYVVNCFNVICDQINVLFQCTLAHALAEAGLSTKVMLFEHYYDRGLYVFRYSEEDDAIEPARIIDPYLFANYCADGTILDVARVDSRTTVALDSNVAAVKNVYKVSPRFKVFTNLDSYDGDIDFWDLLSCLIPIFQINYNTFMDAMRIITTTVTNQRLVEIYIAAFCNIQQKAINAMENMMYLLWSESDVYLKAKYGSDFDPATKDLSKSNDRRHRNTRLEF